MIMREKNLLHVDGNLAVMVVNRCLYQLFDTLLEDVVPFCLEAIIISVLLIIIHSGYSLYFLEYYITSNICHVCWAESCNEHGIHHITCRGVGSSFGLVRQLNIGQANEPGGAGCTMATMLNF